MSLPIPDKNKEVPITTILQWYLERKKGKARKEILQRFHGLDIDVQKEIILAFLSRGKEERAWVYKLLYDYWDNAFMDKIWDVFEKYHEKDCVFLIIQYFPTRYLTYFLEHSKEELPLCCYDYLCYRLIYDHVDYCPDWKKLFLLSPTAVLQAMELTDIKINDSEAYDILYSAVHHYATSVLLDDIEEQIDQYIKEKKKTIVPSDLDYFSELINNLVYKGCNQAVNNFYKWEKELYSTIMNSDTFIKKINGNEECDIYDAYCIMKKYFYRMLPDQFKSPTDLILDEFEVDSSYVKKIEGINPNLTLLIDKLGLSTTDY